MRARFGSQTRFLSPRWWLFVPSVLALTACGGDEANTSNAPGKAGASGKAGSAGSAGTAGKAGAAGKAGGGGNAGAAAGTSAGGTAGTNAGGASGSSGSAGGGGTAGANAGNAGASGSTAGTAGSGGGTAGAAGKAGSAGSGATGGASGAGGLAGAGGAAGSGNQCVSQILCGAQGTCCAVGDQCIAGACVPACASNVRCGLKDATCCAVGDVCVAAACVKPSGTCVDFLDCNENEFCEPTLGQCLPQANTSQLCEYRPPTTFEPVLKWAFETPVVRPEWDQGVSAPLVIDVDRDGTPDVITATKHNPLAESEEVSGYVRLLDGKTGKEKWGDAVDANLLENVIDTSSAMVGVDLDGTGVIIVARAMGGDLVAFDKTGKRLWRSTNPDTTPFTAVPYHSALSAADMDGDGKGEIVVGGTVFDSKGVVVSGAARASQGGVGYRGSASPYGVITIVSDVDGDGKQDVVTGNGAYRRDGTVIWENGLPDGLVAIADLDNDGAPEIVVASHPSVIRVLDAKTGAQKHILGLGGVNAGPPVIADFDGDGKLEIGIQRDNNGEAIPCDYSVLEYDKAAGLSVKWTSPLHICSGFFTATAFDFNGDGSVEVVTHDDCNIVVFDGKAGKRLLELRAPHNTWSEFVSIADVDGDGAADLLFTANDSYHKKNPTYCPYPVNELRHGVFVYSDPERRWVGTRSIWNQESYHITNVRADGTLPKPEIASYGPGGYNNYRVSYQGKGVFNAPDLAVDLEVSQIGCPTQLTVRARVRNAGSLGVAAGVAVSFYAGTNALGPKLGQGITTKPLLPGASDVVEILLDVADLAGGVYAEVDGTSTVRECDETNNGATAGGLVCGKN